MLELRLEFCVSVLQSLEINGETVYNVCGGNKFMYTAMVSSFVNIYERSFVKFMASAKLDVFSCYNSVINCLSLRTFVYF